MVGDGLDFAVLCTRTSNSAGTTAGDIMILGTFGKLLYWYVDRYIRAEVDCITSKMNAPDSAVDIGNAGYLDLVVVY